MVEIRRYEPGSEGEFVRAWNRLLPKDPISMDVFERKILLDPNFDPEGLLMALSGGGEPLGLAYSVVRRYPLYYHPIEEDRGWLAAFSFRDDGGGREAGQMLLDESFKFFRKRRKRSVYYSPYIPNYFFPGLDDVAYSHVYDLMVERGFRQVSEALAMDADLWPEVKAPKNVGEMEADLLERGILIRRLDTSLFYPLLSFLERHMPADWYRHALELLRNNRKDQVWVAIRGGEIVGYCQYWDGEGYDWHSPGSHFGPFGVREDARGMGIGTVLLYKCLLDMRSRGIHRAYVLWTGEEARRLYERFGFKVTRRFKIMGCSLG